jgi:hypothetical protein
MNGQTAKAIFDALKLLAAVDGDMARERNGEGFNKADGPAGHRMANAETLTVKELQYARQMLAKYHRQLPPTLLDQLQFRS